MVRGDKMIDYTAKDIGMIGNFRFWCQKILPAVYDDSLSYYELLCKVIKKLNEVIDQNNEHSEAIIALQAALIQLRDEFEQFKESGFYDYYAEQIEKWIEDNLDDIFIRFLKVTVFFGLTLDGYFVAYIPKSWEEISFDTGAVYSNDDYGRLILRYYVDSPHEVEQ